MPSLNQSNHFIWPGVPQKHLSQMHCNSKQKSKIASQSAATHSWTETDLWSTCSVCWFTTCLDCLHLPYQLAEMKEKVQVSIFSYNIINTIKNFLFVFRFSTMFGAGQCWTKHCVVESTLLKLCMKLTLCSCRNGKAAWKLKKLKSQPSTLNPQPLKLELGWNLSRAKSLK